MRPSGRKLRILDFDIETRRIGFHSAGRFAPDGCEPVIICAAWHGEEPEAWGMGSTWSFGDYVDMVERFRDLYEQADIVTGHYIRKFDLPILNGAMFECGFGPLEPKLVCDTKTDLVDIQGMSKSQENLSALLALEADKFHMNDQWWRQVARLLPEGLELARTRVVKDVVQHMRLREELAFDGWIAEPTEWKP